MSASTNTEPVLANISARTEGLNTTLDELHDPKSGMYKPPRDHRSVMTIIAHVLPLLAFSGVEAVRTLWERVVSIALHYSSAGPIRNMVLNEAQKRGWLGDVLALKCADLYFSFSSGCRATHDEVASMIREIVQLVSHPSVVGTKPAASAWNTLAEVAAFNSAQGEIRDSILCHLSQHMQWGELEKVLLRLRHRNFMAFVWAVTALPPEIALAPRPLRWRIMGALAKPVGKARTPAAKRLAGIQACIDVPEEMSTAQMHRALKLAMGNIVLALQCMERPALLKNIERADKAHAAEVEAWIPVLRRKHLEALMPLIFGSCHVEDKALAFYFFSRLIGDPEAMPAIRWLLKLDEREAYLTLLNSLRSAQRPSWVMQAGNLLLQGGHDILRMIRNDYREFAAGAREFLILRLPEWLEEDAALSIAFLLAATRFDSSADVRKTAQNSLCGAEACLPPPATRLVEILGEDAAAFFWEAYARAIALFKDYGKNYSVRPLHPGGTDLLLGAMLHEATRTSPDWAFIASGAETLTAHNSNSALDTPLVGLVIQALSSLPTHSKHRPALVDALGVFALRGNEDAIAFLRLLAEQDACTRVRNKAKKEARKERKPQAPSSKREQRRRGALHTRHKMPPMVEMEVVIRTPHIEAEREAELLEGLLGVRDAETRHEMQSKADRLLNGVATKSEAACIIAIVARWDDGRRLTANQRAMFAQIAKRCFRLFPELTATLQSEAA